MTVLVILTVFNAVMLIEQSWVLRQLVKEKRIAKVEIVTKGAGGVSGGVASVGGGGRGSGNWTVVPTVPKPPLAP